MREILFRGKMKDAGEWVYGAFCGSDSDTPFGLSVNRANIIMYGGAFDGYWVEVDPETVGQYTGLIDKNGNKIFEGDIVESQYTQEPYLVCFGEYTYTDQYASKQEACGWYNQDIYGGITAFGCPECWATVIGNIHDNPELLEAPNV